MPRAKPDDFLAGKLKEFYDEYLVENNYKVQRFHAIARDKGVPANLVSQALERKKAPLVFSFVSLRSAGTNYTSDDVRDKNNYDFLTKLLIKIGARVPASGDTEAALVHVAKKHSLLGDDITAATLQAWAETEANLQRGLVQFAIRRSTRNDRSRSGDEMMSNIKALVKALLAELPQGLRRQPSSKSSKGSSPKSTKPVPSVSKEDLLYSKTLMLGETCTEQESEGGEHAEEESATDDEMVSPGEAAPAHGESHLHPLDEVKPKEKPFPVRSVPETLEKAADDSFAELSKQGLKDRDLMKAQLQLRKASESFLPAEGPAPSDVVARGRGRGKGRGRGRAAKKSRKSNEEGEESENSEKDLAEEDEQIENELAVEDDEGKTPKKKKTKEPKTPKGEGKTRRKKKNTPKKRATPKLKRAVAAARDGTLVEDVLKEHAEVVANFRKECEEIEDQRFSVPKDLSKIKFTTRAFFLSPVEQSHANRVVEQL